MQDLSSIFYLNYYSVSSLIAFSMSVLLTIYLLRLPDKSPATLMLGMALLMIPIMNVGYFLGAGFYHPLAAYHRWFTVLGSVFPAFLTPFFLYYPSRSSPRAANISMMILLFIGVIIAGYFFIDTLHSNPVYLFSGHFWNINNNQASRLFGIVPLLNSISFLLAGIWRVYTIKKKERWAVLIMAIIPFFCGFAMGVTNLMSLSGLIGREVFQNVYSITAVVGFFTLFVIYINNTRDRTDIMTRIIYISLVTLLLVLQFMSYFSFSDREVAFDRYHRQRLELLLLGQKPPSDLVYLREYDMRTDGAAMRSGETAAVQIDFNGHRTEIDNAYVLARIAALGSNATESQSIIPELEAILTSAHTEAAAYRNFIRQCIKEYEQQTIVESESSPVSDSISTSETSAEIDSITAASDHALSAYIIQRVTSIHRLILSKAYAIRNLPEKDFRTELKALLNDTSVDSDFYPFAQTLQAHLSRTDADGAALRSEILEYVQPMLLPGERLYRADTRPPTEQQHYVVFLQSDVDDQKIYEAGFEYTAYRDYIHESAVRLVYMLIGILVVALIGLRLFFSGSLLTPLRRLLDGVTEVNSGNLNVHVPIQIEDDFGYLSRSFNGMVRSIRESKDKLQDYADLLEARVKERTAELQNSLEEVQQLKNQQDGDYFLTALLMGPLSANKVESDTVSVNFLIEQKKKFQFRRWQNEIGGDTCMAHNIRLRNRRYVVFVNADAMGKSVQGAGGVLVMGSVLEAIIERTRLSSETQKQYPERWLKNAFIEMHKVLETFDGLMLISLVIGLLEEETGMLYYLNAEHPWSVLYRNGKAEFIEDTLSFRKLGTPGVQGNIFIRALQMEPGDVLIAGSDGRDDIRMENPDGTTTVSDNEFAFLAHVETGDGLLEPIVESLKKQGELTDDLSLIRVAYREDAPAEVEADQMPFNMRQYYRAAQEDVKNGLYIQAIKNLSKALNINPHSRRVLRMLALAYVQLKQYDEAIRYGNEYLSVRPGDTDFIYLLAYCHKKQGHLEKAADYGERVRLRDPLHLKNLVNLVDVYIARENFTRAGHLLEAALQQDPENVAARRLQEKLEARTGKI